MQWSDYTTLPSRGLSPRPIGKSSECFQMTAGVKSGKAQDGRMFFRFAPESGLLDLELLPPPALGERRHGGLARRLVAVRRRAILMMSKGERPHPRHPTGTAAAFMMRPTATQS